MHRVAIREDDCRQKLCGTEREPDAAAADVASLAAVIADAPAADSAAVAADDLAVAAVSRHWWSAMLHV